MSSAAPKPWTVEDFLVWEREQDERYEFIDGVVRAMVGGTLAHNTIAGNIFAELRHRLRGGSCRTFVENAKVVSAHGVHYPDVVVTCGPVTLGEDTVPDPVVIIEVVSRSTAGFDRGAKWLACQTLPSLAHYVLAAQNEVRVEVFDRQGDGWTYRMLTGPADRLALPALGVDLPLSLLYEDALPPEA